jgi:eukaryotic-like serine/threonine-protein kinase
MKRSYSLSRSGDLQDGLPAVTWTPPSEFEEYRIVRQLGVGAMGVVYLAHDTLLERPVAIKFLAGLELDPVSRARFYTEARAVARLNHPNVVAIYRVGEVRQHPYLVAEYVAGTSLATLETPIAWPRALHIAIGLARGLGAAHRHGVLHRDLKPANIMLGRADEPKLLDFGLAKLVGDGDAPALEGEPEPARPAAAPGQARDRDLDATQSMAATSPTPRPARRAGATAPSERGRYRTEAGTIVGTPLYMAPELWRSAPASPASDVYAVGVVLHELVTGAAPHAGFTVSALAARVQAEDAPPVARMVPELPLRFAELIDTCLSRDPAARPSSGDALCERLQAVAGRPPVPPEINPYRGLAPFAAEHGGVFFGRAVDADAVTERLRVAPLVIVTGDSGVGKSSLCRAAVLPAVLARPDADRRWRLITLSPGSRPHRRLVAALADHAADDGLVLYVDQLEELITLAEPAEAAAAAELLAELVIARSDVRVLASARSDFLGRLAALPGLGELVGRALYLLGPLSEPGLRDAIVEPAAAAGFAFDDPATVDQLAASSQRHLPLLQFTLAELWQARDVARKTIPAAALARLGGVSGALARHADRVLAGLAAPAHDAVRTILRSLVTAHGTLGRRTHAELVAMTARAPARVDDVLDALVRGRLLVAQPAESGAESSYALAHEALLDGWDTLRRWLDHDAAERLTRDAVERAAAEWDRLGRPAEALWASRRLREAAAVDPAELPRCAADFLRASRRRAARRRTARWTAALGVPAIVLGALAGMRMYAAHRLDARVADLRAAFAHATATHAQLQATRRAAFEAFDTRRPSEAERAWRAALAAEPEAERGYASVAAGVERVLLDAPGRSDARALLADILLERAALADAGHRPFERDDLVRRLALYGAADRWTTPAALSVASNPPGATATLVRYQLEDGRWVASPAQPLGTTPIEHRLAPGSVLVELTLPGRATARLPLVAPRGGDLRVAIELPPVDAVPPGFAYVPAGRFVYGSRGGEEVRVFCDSQPAHEVETGSYLIARDETTFGDWIAFLRQLPPAQRAAHLPRVSRRSITVALRELPDGRYQLALGPDDQPSVALEGEPLRYPGRVARITQDWSRIPVTGVSYEEALDYMAWLQTSGRVPGARPCTEHEWERAARGADGRAFPHGERLAPDDANHDLTYGRVTTAFGPDEVGSHPASDSVFGVRDLAGNVWEWTASLEVPGAPTARGGGFFQASGIARPENRAPDVANRRDAFYGIRVCAPVLR